MESNDKFFSRPSDAKEVDSQPNDSDTIETYQPPSRRSKARNEESSKPADEQSFPTQQRERDESGSYGTDNRERDESGSYGTDNREREERGYRQTDNREGARRDGREREGREFHQREERGGGRMRDGDRGGRREDDRRREGSDRNRRFDERPNQERSDTSSQENIIFGIHPVREAITSGRKIEKIYFRRQSMADDQRYTHQAIPDHVALDQVRRMLLGTDTIWQDVPPERLDRLTRRGNHQGVVAVLPAIDYLDFNKLVERAKEATTPMLIIAIDNVTDVGNFGAIARSAECAGADAIIMSAKNSAPVNADAIRSSAGALNAIPVSRVGSLRTALMTLQQEGLQLVAATEKSNTIVFDIDMTKPTVIIMGSEDRGVSNEILKICDAKASIPMLGKIESLNVSSAAAVLMFEAIRQRYMAIE